jgi:transcriptional regulator with XRE-family HTH domain
VNDTDDDDDIKLSEEERAELVGRISTSLKAWVRHRHLNWSRLEERSGVSRGRIYKVRDGLTMPQIKTLKLLANALEISLGTLMDGDLPPGADFVLESKNGQLLAGSLKEPQPRQFAHRLARLEHRIKVIEDWKASFD